MKPTSSFLVSMRSNLLALLAGCVVAVFVTAQSFTPTDVAWMWQLGEAAGEEPGDECGVDDLTFVWSCENQNVTLGDPSGCSSGDTTASYSSSSVLTNTLAYNGTYSLFSPTSGDNAAFTINADDILNEDIGTISMHWYCVSNIENGQLFIVGSGTNYILLKITSSSKLLLDYRGTGVSRTITSDDAFNTDEWTKVVVKWRRGSSPYLSIELNDGGATVYTTSDLSEMNVAPTTMAIGSSSGTAVNHYIDYFRVWTAWK